MKQPQIDEIRLLPSTAERLDAQATRQGLPKRVLIEMALRVMLNRWEDEPDRQLADLRAELAEYGRELNDLR